MKTEECFIQSFDVFNELFGEIKISEDLRKEYICLISIYKTPCLFVFYFFELHEGA